MLGSPKLREAIPAAGQDFKIMGLRNGRDFVFTVAVALIDRHVANCAEYLALVDAEFESLGSFLADLSRGRLRVY